MRRTSLLIALLSAFLDVACSATTSSPPPNSCGNVNPAALVTAWTADSHFCMIRFADGVAGARQLAVAENGDIFVATRTGQVVVLFDTDGDGVSQPAERSTFTMVTAGNHGVAVTASHVYASSPTTVFRWTYTAGQRTAMGTPEIVVQGIEGGGHDTRALLIDNQNRMYVNIGSGSNVDAPATADTPPSTRALIRRFNLAAIPAGGFAPSDGELFAAGLRNENGLGLDSRGHLWGVENGRDDLSRPTGEDIHLDNPAEEVNLFDTGRAGRNYGYPFCWSEGILTGPDAKGPGTQHFDPTQPSSFSEAKCQNPAVVVPPAFALRAHLAPLDIVEYRGAAYPSEYSGNLFVTSHGSWNRVGAQVGRIIIRLRMGPNGPTQAENFLGEADGAGGLREGGWTLRPVSIRIDHAGLLTFSDDQTGTVNKIGYRP
jgi:glucose/arabinose dehydrogenase